VIYSCISEVFVYTLEVCELKVCKQRICSDSTEYLLQDRYRSNKKILGIEATKNKRHESCSLGDEPIAKNLSKIKAVMRKFCESVRSGKDNQ
jgi:hypothetical protein